MVAARSKATFSCVLGPRFESRRSRMFFQLKMNSTTGFGCPKRIHHYEAKGELPKPIDRDLIKSLP